MSYSTLYKINDKYEKIDQIDYSNSWLFSPIIWDELFWKYIPEKAISPFTTEKTGLMTASMFDKTLWSKLNEMINECDNMNDRLLWEMSNQQCFEGKDLQALSEAVLLGIASYIIPESKDYGNHISERWAEIARDLKNSGCDYVMWKGTSVDDNVQHLFSKYDDEYEEYEACPIPESEHYGQYEFVVIKDGIMAFERMSDRFKN